MEIKRGLMNIIFFGTPDFVIPILEKLKRAPSVNLLAVVTAPDKPVGRKQILIPTPVKAWTQTHQIPVFTPEKLDKDFSNLLISQCPNFPISSIFILAAYGKIIPPEILNLPKYGCLNIHPSLLPKYRGPSPIQAAILAGDHQTGATIIKMDEKIDHGPIVSQLVEEIKPADTTESLSQRLFSKAAEVLVTILPAYCEGRIKLREQNHRHATATKILKRTDGFIDLDNPPPPELFDRLVRAYHPWPGVWSKYPISSPRSVLVQGRTLSEKIIKFLPGERIQMEGGKPMTVRDFLNGYPKAKDWLAKIYH